MFVRSEVHNLREWSELRNSGELVPRLCGLKSVSSDGDLTSKPFVRWCHFCLIRSLYLVRVV